MSELEFRLPDVGEGLSEGEIVEWRVSPGSRVSRDQVLVDVETDKSIVELPSPVNGTVVRLGAEVGQVLEVGAVLVVLETDERIPTSSREGGHGAAPASAPAAPAPEPADPAPEAGAGTSALALPTPAALTAAPAAPQDGPAAPQDGPTAQQDGPTPPQEGSGSGGARRVLASPATRKLALELGVDLTAVTGSGPGGRVSSDDVRAFASGPSATTADAGPAPVPATDEIPAGAPAAGPAPGEHRLADETVPLRGLRRQIARSMTRSWREVPHITEIREVDATALVAARARLRPHLERDGVAFTFLPLLVKAVVATLAEHPKFNASVDLDAETITYHRRRNIGLATATDAGLIVPVLHDADTHSLGGLAREIEVLANAARTRTVTTEQTAQGTFTVTNFGSFGGWIATPIIRPPEAAIAGFGRIRDAVVAVDGVPVVRPTLPISMSADHRLIDGDDMGRFLTTLSSYLVDPVLLLNAT